MPPVVGASKPSNQTRSVSIFGLIQPRVKEFLCGAHVALRQKSPQHRGMPPWREEKGQLSLEFRWRMPEMEHRVPPRNRPTGPAAGGSPAPLTKKDVLVPAAGGSPHPGVGLLVPAGVGPGSAPKKALLGKAVGGSPVSFRRASRAHFGTL